ncbi:cupin domain-containing protein [Aquabacterium sp. CECT 9606]|uniref:cupin domain-containing protein n=1 Tax=Aquabacterium sp. CECT 9606 TaxID=2845822 RepID=UPI001E5A2D17|nr:cupin domain-containing protein [Aquabacterium sp. CECT 9606]
MTLTTNDLNHAPLDAPTTLLGGLSPQQFMRRHWQKKPLLIRQAMPGVKPPVDRTALFALAGQDEVESRLIVQDRATDDWRLRQGPIPRRALPKLDQPGWTLLVQGLDLHVPAAHALLRQFGFVPQARVDDLMISYASDGGGVGPHYDSYDVFLLQVHGRRRWRVGPLKDASLRPDVPLKVLAHFEPQEEWLLEPGDMLYLPPMWGHDGVAEGECMTCSIGFRAPEATEITREVLGRCAEGMDVAAKPRLYKDPQQTATDQPGRIPPDLQQFALEAVQRFLSDPQQIQAALGESLTELKPRVWFEPGEPLPDGVGVVLDAKTRMVYDDKRIFANGESWLAAGADARLMRALADQRQLSALAVAKASPDARELLDQWAEDGWLHPRP